MPEHTLWEGVIVKDAMWSNPREQSAREQMRRCYNDIVENKTSYATEYAEQLKQRFSPEKMYEKFVNLIETQAPSECVVNDMDEIEKLFAEAL